MLKNEMGAPAQGEALPEALQHLDRVCAELGGVYEVALYTRDLHLFVNAEYHGLHGSAAARARLYRALGVAMAAKADELEGVPHEVV